MRILLYWAWISSFVYLLVSCGNPTTANSISALQAAGPTLPRSSLIFSGVTDSSITIHWTLAADSITPATQLAYLAFYTTTDPGPVAPTANDVKTTWIPVGTATTNISQATATGLLPSTNYFFTVLVADVAQHVTVYDVASQETLSTETKDVIAPSLSSATIAISNVTGSGVTLSWVAASDAVTNASDLIYAVYASTSSLTTQAEWQNSSMATQQGAATAAMTELVVTGLAQNTTYYFMVIVTDQAGKSTLYDVANALTLETVPPTAGGSGTVTIRSITPTGATVAWTAGTDGVTPQSALTYQVFYSTTQTQVDTLAHIKSSTPSTQGTVPAGGTSLALTNLAPNATYYVNVVVSNAAGYQAAYTASSFSMTPSDTTGPTPGNAGTITTTNVGTQTLTLVWTPATDSVVTQTALTYTVYQSTYSNVVDTLADIQDLANASKLTTLSGTPTIYGGVMNLLVTGLAQNGAYYFNVVVSDGTYQTAYTQLYQAVVPSAVTGPAPGNSGVMSAANVGATSMTLVWSAATDSVVSQSQLIYHLYESTITNQVNDTTSISSHTLTAVDTYTGGSGTMTQVLTGLAINTTYYFNVVVSNGSYSSAYAPLAQAVSPSNTEGPTVTNTLVSTTNVGTNTLSLVWVAATDTVVSASSLTYTVYESTLSNMVANLAEITNTSNTSNITTVTTVTNATGTITQEVDSLSGGTPYYFNVAVSNGTYTSVYTQVSQVTAGCAGALATRYKDTDGDNLYAASSSPVCATDATYTVASTSLSALQIAYPDPDDTTYNTTYNTFTAKGESTLGIDINGNGTVTNTTTGFLLANPKQWLSFARACSPANANQGSGSAVTTTCALNAVLMADIDFATIAGSVATGYVDAGIVSGKYTTQSLQDILGGASNPYMYTGSVNGNNYAIKNLIVDLAAASGVNKGCGVNTDCTYVGGLIGNASFSGTTPYPYVAINLGFVGDVTGGVTVGGMIGSMAGGQVSGIYHNGSVTGTSTASAGVSGVGGLIGYYQLGQLTSSYNAGSVNMRSGISEHNTGFGGLTFLQFRGDEVKPLSLCVHTLPGFDSQA